jgi:hypothetical protein
MFGFKQNSMKINENIHVSMIFYGCDPNSMVLNKSKQKFLFYIGTFHSVSLTLPKDYFGFGHVGKFCLINNTFFLNDISYLNKNEI